MEWAQYKQEGDTFKSHLPVALDGSCSGIQHYSAMLRDEVGALATNVKMLPGAAQKEDIYQRVADKAIEALEKDVADAEKGYWATAILAQKMIDRKTVKRAVMTLPYGSTYASCHEYVEEELLPKLSLTDIPEAEYSQVGHYVASLVWQAIPQVVQKAREGMDYLQSLARLAGKEGLPVTWTTPVGFPVQQHYAEFESTRIDLPSGGKITLRNTIPIWKDNTERRKVTFATRSDTINAHRQVTGVAPNFIHSLDSSHLMMSVLSAKAKGMNDFSLIHDSLGVHAGYTEAFHDVLKQSFYDLYHNSTPLEDITTHMLAMLQCHPKKYPVLPAKGTLDLAVVKDAEFLFA
jgi:DNA-directed RNA polymerase